MKHLRFDPFGRSGFDKEENEKWIIEVVPALEIFVSFSIFNGNLLQPFSINSDFVFISQHYRALSASLICTQCIPSISNWNSWLRFGHPHSKHAVLPLLGFITCYLVYSAAEPNAYIYFYAIPNYIFICLPFSRYIICVYRGSYRRFFVLFFFFCSSNYECAETIKYQ